MHATGRRTTPEVLKEILAVGPASWSGIRFAVGMSYSQAQRYLPFLVNEGYLKRRPGERGADEYVITEKGKQLFRLLNELTDLLGVPAEQE